MALTADSGGRWRRRALTALEDMGIDPANVLEGGFSSDGYYRIVRDTPGGAVIVLDGQVDREWVFFTAEQREILRGRGVF